MTRSAKVEDINALKAFRVALVKFAEAANVALADADSDGRRMQGWIERDQSSLWQTQIRKRTELLSRAEEALRMKQNFKQADGSYPNPFEEQKAVMLAKRRLVEAHRNGLLELSRADLVQAMDPVDVRESETPSPNDTAHFIRIEKEQP